jgi:hypothetical protein
MVKNNKLSRRVAGRNSRLIDLEIQKIRFPVPKNLVSFQLIKLNQTGDVQLELRDKPSR